MSKTIKLLIALSIYVAATLSVQANNPSQDSTIVKTKYGKVAGTLLEESGVIAWLGIPYAQAPTGELRWKSPEPTEPWTEVLDTKSYSSSCAQAEDCLYLNIWKPVPKFGEGPKSNSRHNRHKQKALPVLVWIHGGSNTGGSGQGTWFNAANSFNAIVVSINYRLGPMGWFSHPALKHGDRNDDSGNFGTLDQIAALKWVKKNIRSFGGDPNNITLAGESAGAQNVSYLMHSRLAKRYFHKAIIESNFPGIRPVAAAYKSSKQVLYNLLVSDGSANSHAEAKEMADSMPFTEIENYFRGKTMAEIREVYQNPYWGGINWGDFYRDDIAAGDTGVPLPVVQQSENRPEFVYAIGDGHVLPAGLDFADFTRGNVYPKPVVVGETRNENNLWNASWPFNYRGGVSLDQLVDEAVTGTVPFWIQYLVPFLQAIGTTPEEFKSNYKFATELIDEVGMHLGSHLSASNMTRAYPNIPVYVYRFDWGSDEALEYNIPFEDAWKFYIGSPHGAELPFFYQDFTDSDGVGDVSGYQYNDENLAGRQLLSSAIGGYLKSFIYSRSGKIASKNPIRWKRWKKNKPQFIEFDASRESLDIKMNSQDIARDPQQLYDSHSYHQNAAVRDFIEYYVMWSWHWNWYPQSSVTPFDTSPGPNPLFSPNDP